VADIIIFSSSFPTQLLQRSRALTFVEFLDALCRVADMISPPPTEELLSIGCEEPHPTTHYYMKVRK